MNVTGIRNLQGKLMLIQLKDCTVTYKEEILFLPEYGIFNMVVGKEIVSAFAGAADNNSFPNLYHASEVHTIKPPKSEASQRLEEYYTSIRNVREQGLEDEKLLRKTYDALKADYQKEWLLYLEILEISKDVNLKNDILDHLASMVNLTPHLNNLINEGIEIIEKSIQNEI